MAVPNVSEGRDRAVLERLEASVGPARVLDLHVDPDHNRAVYTLAARQRQLAAGLVGLARAAAERIDLREHHGIHPHVGSLDVMPVVWQDDERRGAACAEALTAAALVGEEVGVPVFLYGELATRPSTPSGPGCAAAGRPSSRGGWRPASWCPTTARRAPTRAPAPSWPRPARRWWPSTSTWRPTTSSWRSRSPPTSASPAEGPPASRALGLYLAERGRAQVSTNVHDHRAVPLAEIVERVRARAPVAEGELIGLAPRAAFEGFPEDVPLRGFSPERHILEEALAALE